MTEIKKFQRGHRTYTRVGKFKEVRIGHENPSVPTPEPAKRSVQMDIDPRTENGFYSNTSLVHRSQEEVVIDFSFIAPNSPRGRIMSRVILSPKHAKALSVLLKNAAEEDK